MLAHEYLLNSSTTMEASMSMAADASGAFAFTSSLSAMAASSSEEDWATVKEARSSAESVKTSFERMAEFMKGSVESVRCL